VNCGDLFRKCYERLVNYIFLNGDNEKNINIILGSGFDLRRKFMNKTLFVIAMEKEASPIIEKLNLKQKQESLYGNEKIDLLITGIGKQRTAINLVRYLENNPKPEKIINIGYCGSNAFDIGEIINVTSSFNYEWHIPGEEKYSMKDLRKSKFRTIRRY